MAVELHNRLARSDVKIITRLKCCVECSIRFRATKGLRYPLALDWFFWNNRFAPLPVQAKAGCLAVGRFSIGRSLIGDCHELSEGAACRLCPEWYRLVT